ncbi:MAG: hypothetical protein A3D24_01885 [Candidatus Blackburnbacteria bacterium RIFCSPHIGHO2_02_FULL_39_13]|nr:MAG: hypothetical protein UT38_C0004G0018 [Microgenomates group bacterium GW2011_GWA2_39_19]OGY07357.1 MAG: hypothetical protein A2694_01100 [Candidatus Blackburnbacteria bacterium RIFCSPHIGHO2_01_FULL_40_17]OGY09151.1 MAG: hypothetical protein A3D24_01885 [Candidatus Blackburnbacteria bacterium RIFCSPHIGHO2_02_FULL_39_13]
MNLYFYGLLIPIFSFIFQVWPRIINRYFGVDTWRHLMYANYVREHKSFPKEISDHYVVTGPYGYPPVIIKILSLFSKSFNEKYQFIFSPIFDFLHNYFIFFTALLVTNDLTTAIFAQIIAALTPLIVIEASNLNTRVISYLIFSLSFFPLIMYSTSHLLIWLAVAFIGLVLLFYTHRFAIQAYLFCAIGLSIIEGNPLYIGFVVTTFIIVYFSGGNFYKSILNEHFALLNFWRKNIDYRFAHQIRGNLKPKQIDDFIFKVYNLSFKNPYVYILGNNPWLGIYLFALLLPFFDKILPGLAIISPIMFKINVWVLTLLISSLLVLSIKGLRFLGEGNRYLEYAVFPVSILLGSYFSILSRELGSIFPIAFVPACLVMFFLIIFLQKKTIVGDRGRTIGKELWEIINYLNTNDGDKVRIAVFPISLGDAIMYFTKGRVLTSDSIFGQIKLGIFPIVNEPFMKLVNRYDLNYVLIDQTYVKPEELSLRKKYIVKNINNFTLLKIR